MKKFFIFIALILSACFVYSQNEYQEMLCGIDVSKYTYDSNGFPKYDMTYFGSKICIFFDYSVEEFQILFPGVEYDDKTTCRIKNIVFLDEHNKMIRANTLVRLEEKIKKIISKNKAVTKVIIGKDQYKTENTILMRSDDIQITVIETTKDKKRTMFKFNSMDLNYFKSLFESSKTQF